MSHRQRTIVVAVAVVTAWTLAVGTALAARPGGGGPRTIQFDGHDWLVKSSSRKIGPGPNLFSSSTSNVWVDAAGRLHLKISKSGGRWYSAEVINTASLGRGTYSWTVEGDMNALDRQVVLGLFTWNDDPAFNHRELDVEFARWGNASDPTNGQYVVQPYDTAGNLVRITQPSGITGPTTHGFTWGTSSVSFTSSTASPSSWTYAGPDVPEPGGENARMNLWLFRGIAPSNGQAVEVVISDFTFTPLGG